MELKKPVRTKINKLEEYVNKNLQEDAKNLLSEIIEHCSNKVKNAENSLKFSAYTNLVIEAIEVFLREKEKWNDKRNEINKLKEEKDIEKTLKTIENILKQIESEINNEEVKNLLNMFLKSLKNKKQEIIEEHKGKKITITTEDGDFEIKIGNKDKKREIRIIISY